MKNCENCHHFNNNGYKDSEHSKNLGFCNRFIQVVNLKDNECIAFIKSEASRKHHEYLQALEKYKLLLNSQLNLFEL